MITLDTDQKEYEAKDMTRVLGTMLEMTNEVAVISESVELDAAQLRSFQQAVNQSLDNLATAETNFNS